MFFCTLKCHFNNISSSLLSLFVNLKMVGREVINMYVPFNPNPLNKRTDDCVLRALSKALNKPWEEVYIDLCLKGLELADWGNSNEVWDEYLRDKGFKREIIPDTCPDCYTLIDFCKENPTGEYIICTGSHVIFVKDGNFYDSWNSENVVPIYYYAKT